MTFGHCCKAAAVMEKLSHLNSETILMHLRVCTSRHIQCIMYVCVVCSVLKWLIIIIIIIIERKDLGGVMSRDCKDTVQKLKTVTERECDAR